MQTPEEFVKLCQWFHQDCDYGLETDEQIIEEALLSANLSLAQRGVVKSYIDELVSGRYSDEELERIWRKSGAGVSILTDQAGNPGEFLRMIQSAIKDINDASPR